MQVYGRVGIVLSIATAALLNAPATASVTPSCMIKALPGETREQLTNAYAEGGADAVKNVITVGVLVDTAERCIEYGEGNFDQLILRARIILVGFAYQEGAAAKLSSSYNISRATLEQAWASLTQEQRKRFGQLGKSDDVAASAMIAFVHSVRPEIPVATLEKMRAKNNPGPEFAPLIPVVTDLAAFAMGRGLLEASPN